jgi:hypothetical protein
MDRLLRFLWSGGGHMRGDYIAAPPWPWLVLSPEGEFLGRTSAPGRHFHRGHVLTSEEDPESGERFPVLYRIRSAVPGLEY